VVLVPFGTVLLGLLFRSVCSSLLHFWQGSLGTLSAPIDAAQNLQFPYLCSNKIESSKRGIFDCFDGTNEPFRLLSVPLSGSDLLELCCHLPSLLSLFFLWRTFKQTD
jgi:hypothetical protein